VPFVAKATGRPIAKIAARVMAGEPLAGFEPFSRELDYIAVKESVFPFARFPGTDPVLGPEMKSTGEVMGIDRNFDIAFAKAMIAWMESNFCVDPTRIMSTGFSYGGIMSDTIGCQMPDVFRALGVMSGSLFSSGSSCKSHPIAAWITHGDADPTVDISGDETARDRFLADNHCGTTSTAVTPSPCLSYDNCDNGYPVVWCPVAGEGHTIPSFAASGIANFFAQF